MVLIFCRITVVLASWSININVGAFSQPKVPSLHRPNVHLLATTQASSTPRIEDCVTPKKLLRSDAQLRIESLVNERSQARWDGNYDQADEIRKLIDEVHVDLSWRQILQSTNTTFQDMDGDPLIDDLDQLQGFKVTITDFPRSDGGGSRWDLDPIECDLNATRKEDNVLQLAHAAVGMAVSMSDQSLDVDETLLNRLIIRAKARLSVLKNRKTIADFLPRTSGSELHGRKAADAALWFSLAGVVDDKSLHLNLYDELVNMTADELLRFGKNKSCRAKDVLHMVERIAMSGYVGPSVQRLYNIAADILESKTSNHEKEEVQNLVDINDEEYDGNVDYQDVMSSLRDLSFGLHSNRSLLGLWRFSTRQRKQKIFFQNAARHYDGTFRDHVLDETEKCISDIKCEDKYKWSHLFKDPTLPLVIDVGCGMGVSLLGLANQNSFRIESNSSATQHIMALDLEKCNFLGVDLSRLGIRYANGVCSRWGLGHHLTFVVDSAESCLSRIRDSYPGDVGVVMIQFPTPFRFQPLTSTSSERGYNSQLPQDAASGDFMVTNKLLSEIHETLSKSGSLFIQSNCEDVAVHMMNIGKQVGFNPLVFDQCVTKDKLNQLGKNVPKRARDWQENGGERAIGPNWSLKPILPGYGRTETEVACMLDGKPVHRCIMVPR